MRRFCLFTTLSLLIVVIASYGQVVRVDERLFVNLGNLTSFAGDGSGGACAIANTNGQLGVYRFKPEGGLPIQEVSQDNPALTGLSMGSNDQFVTCSKTGQIWFTASLKNQNGFNALLLKENDLVKVVLAPWQFVTHLENGKTLVDQVLNTVSRLQMKNGRLMIFYKFSQPDNLGWRYPAGAEIEQTAQLLRTLMNPFNRAADGAKDGTLGCLTDSGNHWYGEWDQSGFNAIRRWNLGVKTLEIPGTPVYDGVTCIGDSAYPHFKDAGGRVHIERVRDGSNVREDIAPSGAVGGYQLADFTWHWGVGEKIAFLMPFSLGKVGIFMLDPDTRLGELIKSPEVAPFGNPTEMHPSGNRILVKIGTEVHLVLKPEVPEQTLLVGDAGGAVRVKCQDCFWKNALSPLVTIGDRQLEATPSADYIDLQVPPMAAGEYQLRIKVADFTFDRKIKVERTARASVKSVEPATFQGSALTQGGLFTIKGQWLCGHVSDPKAGFVPSVTLAPTGAPWPTKLGAVRVLVGGKPVPLQFAVTFPDGSSQINGQYPWTADSEIIIESLLDLNSETVIDRIVARVKILPLAPSVFGHSDYPVILQNLTQDSSGSTLVSQAHPARPSDWLTAYGTGFGPTDPPLTPGMSPRVQGVSLARVQAQVKAWIKLPSDYWEIQEVQAFASPEFPAVTQMNFRVPEDLPVPPNGMIGFLILSVGGVTDDREDRYPVYFTPKH